MITNPIVPDDFTEGELERNSTVAKFATVQTEGNRKAASDKIS